MYYNGIRIAAGEGTAVQATADGLVIFSAPLKDYGETIIIRHEDQYATVYSHLGIRTVRGETRVKKGDRIAFLGKGENQEEPYLHFEIRYKNKARNPLFFLP
jgi:lipoprotein NlpD